MQNKSRRLQWFGAAIPVFLFFLFPLSTQAAADKATQAGMVAHKALYEIRLNSKKSNAKISNIHGKMMYQWHPDCDGWVSNHHFDVTYEYFETPPVRMTSDFSNYESFDGKKFNFTATRKNKDLIISEIRGSVEGDIQANGGTAIFNKPETLEFDLPAATYFPTAHTLSVLDSIKAGKKFYNATIFDGSDEEGPVSINSFVLKSEGFVPDEEYKKDIDETLINGESWKLRLAYFPLNKYAETSDYEMTIIFHENGIIGDMLVEYDEFSVVQKLVALESVDNACNTGQATEAKEEKK